MLKILFTTAAVSILLNASTPAFAHEEKTLRSITVSGQADVQATPDEVVLTLGIESRNKDLSEVRRINDQRMNAVLAALIASGVASKDIRTDYLNLQPDYEFTTSGSASKGKKNFVGYVQKTTVEVTLKDVTKFEILVASVLKAGVEYIHGIEFKTSELRKYQDQSRSLAMQAARQKAIALAAELNQKVGKPRSITEGLGGTSSSYGRWGSGQWEANVVHQYNRAMDSSHESVLAPGVLNVRATVTLTFDLE
ncbi:hypothetical protein BH11PSE11_BH11PSE11_20350 [soil metagenome]